MTDSDDILISVRSRFINGMLAGTKRVELRRRAPRIDTGTRIWIYDKAPVAAVRAVAILATVETMAPEVLWRRYEKTLGLSLDEYNEYVAGCDQATALSLEDVSPVRPVSLNQLRKLSRNFHPPQFYLRMEPHGSLLAALERHLDPAGCFEVGCCQT